MGRQCFTISRLFRMSLRASCIKLHQAEEEFDGRSVIARKCCGLNGERIEVGARIKRLQRILDTWPRPLRFAIAIGLTLVGLSGLILPILPGWIFLIPGLLLLSRETGVGRKSILQLKCWYRSKSRKHLRRHRKAEKRESGTDEPGEAH